MDELRRRADGRCSKVEQGWVLEDNIAREGTREGEEGTGVGNSVESESVVTGMSNSGSLNERNCLPAEVKTAPLMSNNSIKRNLPSQQLSQRVGRNAALPAPQLMLIRNSGSQHRRLGSGMVQLDATSSVIPQKHQPTAMTMMHDPVVTPGLDSTAQGVTPPTPPARTRIPGASGMMARRRVATQQDADMLQTETPSRNGVGVRVEIDEKYASSEVVHPMQLCREPVSLSSGVPMVAATSTSIPATPTVTSPFTLRQWRPTSEWVERLQTSLARGRDALQMKGVAVVRNFRREVRYFYKFINSPKH